ncbi:hypothetical protein B0H16DRAFT_1253119, partial [Mycena metata]
HGFKDPNVPALTLRTLGAHYEPGYVDHPLVWTKNGGDLAYGQYESGLLDLLDRPEAVAFIGMGGVPRFVAERYNPDLVDRFARGPSYQTTQFAKGQMALFFRGSVESFYTRESVSHSEMGMLLGLIAGSNPDSLRTIWPTPAVMKAECAHWNGYLSSGLVRILENIAKDIDNGIYRWRTYSHWREYFRTGNKGLHAAGPKTSELDLKVGQDLYDRSFPAIWEVVNIRDLTVPEPFEPLSD